MDTRTFFMLMAVNFGVEEADKALSRLEELSEAAPSEQDSTPENGWLRVGNIEVSPSSMWKELLWEDGKAYCASLDCFMPDKDQLAVILENKAVRAVIDGRCFMGDWLWSSSEYSSHLAWRQRPSDGPQHVTVKLYDCWVVPCRRLSL